MFSLLQKILLVLVVITVLIFLKRFSDHQVDEDFDERQILYRQKSYANAAWAALIFNIFVFIEGDSLMKIMSLSSVGVVTIFLIAGVFAVSSILYDAYFSARKKKRMVVLFLLVSTLQLAIVLNQWQDGDFFQNGHLYMTFKNSVPIVFIITFGFVLLTTSYKSWKDKHEVEE